MTSVLTPLITLPLAAPEALFVPLAYDACGRDAEASAGLFHCLFECGVSGADFAAETSSEPAGAAAAAEPFNRELPLPNEAAAGDGLPASARSEPVILAQQPPPEVFVAPQMALALKECATGRPSRRIASPELRDKYEETEEPVQREESPQAAINALLLPAVLEPASLQKLGAPKAAGEFAFEPAAAAVRPAPQADPAPQPARQDPNLAFRLVLRPEEPASGRESPLYAAPDTGKPDGAPQPPGCEKASAENAVSKRAALPGASSKPAASPAPSGTPELKRGVQAPPPLDAVTVKAPEEASKGRKPVAEEAPRPVKAPGALELHLPAKESESDPPPERPSAAFPSHPRPQAFEAGRSHVAPAEDERGAPPPGVNRLSPPEERPAPAAAVRQVFVRVDRGGARPVEVGLAERAGRVEVSVRSADAGLNRALREDLGDLVGRLRERGFETSGWMPREHPSTERTEWAANGREAQGEGPEARERFGAPQEQRHRRRPPAPWLEAFDEENTKKGAER